MIASNLRFVLRIVARTYRFKSSFVTRCNHDWKGRRFCFVVRLHRVLGHQFLTTIVVPKCDPFREDLLQCSCNKGWGMTCWILGLLLCHIQKVNESIWVYYSSLYSHELLSAHNATNKSTNWLFVQVSQAMDTFFPVYGEPLDELVQYTWDLLCAHMSI